MPFFTYKLLLSLYLQQFFKKCHSFAVAIVAHFYILYNKTNQSTVIIHHLFQCRSDFLHIFTCYILCLFPYAITYKLLVVEIYMDETQELIYQSKALPVGSYIENARLDKVLEAGEYQATAYFKAYREEDQTFIGQAGAAIKITVLS